MGRKAKPLQQQIDLLRQRGMTVDDPEKARHILLEVGWYRMSFYWFPFETRYPDRLSEVHEFRRGTRFEDALYLYAFDFNLRHTLLKPLERVETAFRTYMIYAVSNRYPESPEWMADPKVVGPAQARSFERVVYMPMKRANPELQLHHRRFPRDRFAPAWKTLEFVTFGGMCALYTSLLSDQLKLDIARHFGVHHVEVFENYLEVVRTLRNLCAHGNVLYSYRPGRIHRGPAMEGRCVPPDNLRGALAVVEHFLGVISERLLLEFRTAVSEVMEEVGRAPGAATVIGRIFRGVRE